VSDRREKEVPLIRVFLLILDGEDPGRRLLLKPLTRIPRVDPGRLRQLPGRRRAAVSERTVKAEPIAQVDAEQIEGRDSGLEEPLTKRIAGSSRRAGRH